MFFLGKENFNKDLYPGYNNKKGDSSWCDESFLVGEYNTFKFMLLDDMLATWKLLCVSFQAMMNFKL